MIPKFQQSLYLQFFYAFYSFKQCSMCKYISIFCEIAIILCSGKGVELVSKALKYSEII